MECDKIWTQDHSTTKTKTMSSRNPKSAEVTLLPLYTNPSSSNITNTPITYKALDASNYNSKKQHHVNTNKLLANEIMDKFLGPMLPDLFLKWYLPLDKPNMECSESEWPEICKGMKEVGMYLLFVSSIPYSYQLAHDEMQSRLQL